MQARSTIAALLSASACLTWSGSGFAAGDAAGSRILERIAEAFAAEAPEPLRGFRVSYKIGLGGLDELSTSQVVSYLLPDKMRQTIWTELGQQTIVLNGARGAMSAGDRSMPLPRTGIEEGLRSLRRDLAEGQNHRAGLAQHRRGGHRYAYRLAARGRNVEIEGLEIVTRQHRANGMC